MRRLVVLLLLLLPACGYHFHDSAATLPGGVQRIDIPLFENRTLTPQLEDRLTSEVIELFGRRHNVRVVPAAEAEAVLTGGIQTYQTHALSYAQGDRIRRFRASMVIEARLTRSADQALLWEGTLRREAEYSAADDKMIQEGDERLAREELSRRLAEELYFRIFDDF